jgi:hypothetical protein
MKCFRRFVRAFWPVGLDSEPVEVTKLYREAVALKTSVAGACAGKNLEPVLKSLERQHDDSHSRRDQLTARAQGLVQLTSALAALIYGGVGGILVAPPDKVAPRSHWLAAAFSVAALGFLLAIQAALKSLQFRQYSHPSIEDLLKAGKVESKEVNADAVLTWIPATAYNEEQNNRKATALNYSYRYLRLSLWFMFLIALVAVFLRIGGRI